MLTKLSLLITLSIASLKAAITTTYTFNFPTYAYHINQLGTSTKVYSSAPGRTELIILDVVNPVGGFGAPAVDKTILPPSPGDWTTIHYGTYYASSDNVIIVANVNTLLSVTVNNGQIAKTYIHSGSLFPGFGSIRGADIFISGLGSLKYGRFFYSLATGIQGSSILITS